MRASQPRRPTEDRAIASASSAARPLPSVECLLQALITAYRAGDRCGFCLAAHRAVRAALGNDVEEVTRAEEAA